MSTIPFTSGTCWCSMASIPWRSVTSAIPHPWHPPAIRSMTTASCTSISSTRPPCRATIGLTWESNSSATRSYSVSSSAPPAATGAAGFGATAGRSPASADRIAAPTGLPITCHGAALRLTTVTRLPDTMTSATSAPGIAKISSTRGEPFASSGDANRRTPPSCTGSLTRNLQRALSIGSAVMRISALLMKRSMRSPAWGVNGPAGDLLRSSARRCRGGRGNRSQLPGRMYHVAQRRERLVPAPRLEAAVGVHPNLPVVQHTLHALQGGDDLGGARDARRVDVVHARPDLVGILVLAERLQQLGPRARALDRDHVGVHLLDHPDDVVELAVAHVRVDLGRVRHAARGETERVHRPLEVRRPFRPLERQAFP